MSTYISLLRGINVSGKNKIKKEELKLVYEDCGCENVQIYIQSGNIVFSCAAGSDKKLKGLIEKTLENKLGSHIECFIWPAKTFQTLIKSNPFLRNKNIEQDKLHFTFLSTNHSPSSIKKIEQAKTEDEAFHIEKKVAYIYCPHGYGKTRINNNFIEKATNTNATTRNLKTAIALCELAGLE